MKGELLFLGTGGSLGIPVVGCKCPLCLSLDPQNKRLRSAVLITVGGKKILIDAGPDFREQALRAGITHLDAVLLTHPHFDHMGGLDDLRALYFSDHKPLDCVTSSFTLEVLKKRYDYLFLPKEKKKSLTAQLQFRVLESLEGSFTVEGIPIQYFSYSQSGVPVTGFRIGDLAYVSDIREYPIEIFASLKNVRTLIVSALRVTPSPMHFTVEEAIDFAQKIAPEKTYFTHIAHELDPANLSLPAGFSLSYDGLTCDFIL